MQVYFVDNNNKTKNSHCSIEDQEYNNKNKRSIKIEIQK